MKPYCFRRTGQFPCFDATHVSILSPGMSTGSMSQLHSICWVFPLPLWSSNLNHARHARNYKLHSLSPPGSRSPGPRREPVRAAAWPNGLDDPVPGLIRVRPGRQQAAAAGLGWHFVVNHRDVIQDRLPPLCRTGFRCGTPPTLRRGQDNYLDPLHSRRPPWGPLSCYAIAKRWLLPSPLGGETLERTALCSLSSS